MADLSSFKEENGASLDSFKMEQEAPTITTKKSGKNFAATVAMMEDVPDRALETYNLILNEVDGTGLSTTSEELLQRVRTSELEGLKAAVMDFVADPNIDDDTKLNTIGSMTDIQNEMFNSRNLLSTKALSVDSGFETPKEEAVRVDIAGAINEINEFKKWKQAVINREVAKADVSTGKAVMDIMSFIAPYTEQARITDIVTEFNKQQEAGANSLELVAEAVTFMGSMKSDIKEYLTKMSIEERRGVIEGLVSIIQSSDGIVLTDENDFAKVEFLRTFLEDGYYTDFDMFIDNTVSLLDTTVVGGFLGRLASKPVQALRRSKLPSMDEIDADIAREFAKPGAQPASVASNVKEVNPEKSRQIHDLALQDETGEAAEALYGVSREEAIAGDILPEVATASEKVSKKTSEVGKNFDQRMGPDADVEDFVRKDGTTYIWEDEKRRLRSRTYESFKKAEGVKLLSEASQIGEATSGGARIRAVYGTEEGGFRTAEEAREKVKLALRDFGIKDEEIVIKRRGPDGYSKSSDLSGEGDFIARVDYEYKFNPFDPVEMSEFDVKWNLFDRFQHGSWAGGTIQRNILDIHSMLNKEATISANAVVDKSAGMERAMLELGKKFTDVFVSLPKDRQGLVEQYLKEANEQGLPFDINRLVANGYQPAEIQAIKNWRKFWDTAYWAENRDLGLTLRSQGYKIMEDPNTNTRLFARPAARNQVSGSIDVYDQTTDTIRKMSADEVSQLYKDGGQAAKLRTPVEVNGDFAEYIVASNRPGGSYLRGIRDGDQVLNYRDGYYQVQYTAPKFIVKRVKDKNGKVVYEKAVAVAGNTADAAKRGQWYAANEGGRFGNDVDADFFVREDVRGEGLRGDDQWNSLVSSGRTAQRVRGQRLSDASSNINTGTADQFIMSPVDSMIHSARSVSRRVPMRPYIETMKRRFLEQYKDWLPKENGMPVFPSTRDQIGRAGITRDKELADARTVWEYINYMEGGYINSIDDGSKRIMRGLADLFAKAGLNKAEELTLAAAGRAAPTGFAKNLAFQLYLALNPVRQFVIQSHQAALLTANFGEYVLKGTLARDLSGLVAMQLHGNAKIAAKLSGRSEAEITQMMKEFQRSGLAASVDKQNLIRGSLTEMADTQIYQGKVKPVTTAISASRKVGFDSGEYINIASAWLAHRDKMVKSGRKMDDTALEEVSGLARNYTYNMNSAGDMPYNQNSLSVIFQFMQVPHKAMTQVAFNRVLTGAEKAKLLGFQAVMYTLPPGAMYALFSEILPDDEEAADAIVQGLEGLMINKLLTLATGEKTSIDFGSLAPLDAYGTWEFLTSLWTTDLGEIISNTPSGQLFFGANPRITNWAKMAARYFNLVDDYEDPTTFSQVAEGFLRLSSGYSNAFQGAYSLKYGQKMNAYGGITDPEVNTAESFARRLMGVPTMDETRTYYVKNKLYEESKAFEDDVRAWYKDLKRHLADKEMDVQQADYAARVLNEAWRVFDDNKPRAREIITRLLRKDISQGDATLYKSVIQALGMGDAEMVRGMVRSLPNLDEAQRKEILETVDYIESYKEPE